jgi:hypothetical protein
VPGEGDDDGALGPDSEREPRERQAFSASANREPGRGAVAVSVHGHREEGGRVEKGGREKGGSEEGGSDEGGSDEGGSDEGGNECTERAMAHMAHILKSLLYSDFICANILGR